MKTGEGGERGGWESDRFLDVNDPLIHNFTLSDTN